MLDFSFDSSTEIKVFTSIRWIREKYGESCFKFMEIPEGSDICIVDSEYGLMNTAGLKISVDKHGEREDVYIPECHIEAYLELLQKFDPDICGIGIADISDVIKASRGSLVKHVKTSIASDNEMEYINEFMKNLEGGAFSGSAVLFVSEKDYDKLNSLGSALEGMYENLEIVLFTPSSKNNNLGKFIELFLFNK